VKGIELPINILVVVAVAVIVLLGVVALFFSGWFSGTAPMSIEAAKSQACNIASRQGCAVADPTAIAVSYGDASTLQEICEIYYQITAGDTVMCLNSVCGMNC
jgi:hypothetical protein